MLTINFDPTYLGHVVGNGKVRPEKNENTLWRSFQSPRQTATGPCFSWSHWVLPKVHSQLCRNSDSSDRSNSKRCIEPCCMDCWVRHSIYISEEGIVLLYCTAKSWFSAWVYITNGRLQSWCGSRSKPERGRWYTERPVTYYSRKLLPREERYSTVEKECLAIKLACYSCISCVRARQTIRYLDWSPVSGMARSAERH